MHTAVRTQNTNTDCSEYSGSGDEPIGRDALFGIEGDTNFHDLATFGDVRQSIALTVNLVESLSAQWRRSVRRMPAGVLGHSLYVPPDLEWRGYRSLPPGRSP